MLRHRTVEEIERRLQNEIEEGPQRHREAEQQLQNQIEDRLRQGEAEQRQREAEAAALRSHMEVLTVQLREMQSSLAWRWTAPLRRPGTRFRRRQASGDRVSHV